MEFPRSVQRVGALIASVLVVAWRVMAFIRPSSLIEQEPGFATALAGVGLSFVVAGLAAYWIRPGITQRLFLAWCLASGVHWGGAIGAASANLEVSLLLLYITISVAGEAALVHLALSFQPTWRTPRWMRSLLYVPAAVGLVLTSSSGMLSAESIGVAAGILILAGTLLGIAAGLIFVTRWFRADRRTRRKHRLGIVVACLLAAGVPSLLASLGLVPGPGDAYNLLSVLAPAGLCYALIRRPDVVAA